MLVSMEEAERLRPEQYADLSHPRGQVMRLNRPNFYTAAPSVGLAMLAHSSDEERGDAAAAERALVTPNPTSVRVPTARGAGSHHPARAPAGAPAGAERPPLLQEDAAVPGDTLAFPAGGPNPRPASCVPTTPWRARSAVAGCAAGFGSIYLGETFTAFVSACNNSTMSLTRLEARPHPAHPAARALLLVLSRAGRLCRGLLVETRRRSGAVALTAAAGGAGAGGDPDGVEAPAAAGGAGRRAARGVGAQAAG